MTCVGGVPVRGLGSSRALCGGVAGPKVDGAGDQLSLSSREPCDEVSVRSTVPEDGA